MPTLRTVIANTFMESLDRLTADEQAVAKETAFDLQHRPEHPSFQLHRLEGSDPNFWSARVNLDLRIILHRRGADQVVCYVDHHDPAYEWAKRRKLDVHETTGAAQFVVIDERVVEVIKRITRVQPDSADDEPGSQRPLEHLGANLARVHYTMRLEDQALQPDDLKHQRERLIASILARGGSRLWDEP